MVLRHSLRQPWPAFDEFLHSLIGSAVTLPGQHVCHVRVLDLFNRSGPASAWCHDHG
jgi:hypothetical protein